MSMPKRIGTAWIANQTIVEMIVEADRTFPQESGGVLLGYWTKLYTEIVITCAIGPGPKAVHRSHAFCPDTEYQEAEIARQYEESNRLHGYVGDWHTHPRSTSHLSRKDRRTLNRIAKYPEARMSMPIMAVLGGPPWSLDIWRIAPGLPGRLPFIPFVVPMKMRRYSLD
jgi:integrative and conjugative element protein (TIGR02256 family)